MTDQGTPFGLDQSINLAGRMTTIRQQHEDGKVSAHRLAVTRASDGVTGPVHCFAIIQKDDMSTEQFPISEPDYNYLMGRS